jgi:hypothetical protein
VIKMSVPNPVALVAGKKDEEQIDRKCAACEMENEEEEAKMEISRKPSAISNLEASDEITNEINEVRSSSGSPLDESTRSFMESRFGYDFGKVKIHADEVAARSANSVNALAYTIGNDIVFGQGQYQPNTPDGRRRRLLAHELTHVVQQGRWNEQNQISRFSDMDHNIIEEVALTLANLSPEEIKQIHVGNTKQDYSQSPDPRNQFGFIV